MMEARTEWPDIGTRGLVEVRLSRRNLESLLHMLDSRSYGKPALMSVDDEYMVLVLPEENADHYADREPGSMSWEEDE